MVRGEKALIDVSLLLMVALFGSLILIPLYYQQVRHEGAVAIGLLLAPQGLGAALALPQPWRADDADVNADSGAAAGGEQAKAA